MVDIDRLIEVLDTVDCYIECDSELDANILADVIAGNEYLAHDQFSSTEREARTIISLYRNADQELGVFYHMVPHGSFAYANKYARAYPELPVIKMSEFYYQDAPEEDMELSDEVSMDEFFR